MDRLVRSNLGFKEFLKRIFPETAMCDTLKHRRELNPPPVQKKVGNLLKTLNRKNF